MYEPGAANHNGNGFQEEEGRQDDAPSISLNRSRARDRFQRAARSATAMLNATDPARRKGLLADRKEAELEALVEQKLERGDLAPLVRCTMLLLIIACVLLWQMKSNLALHGTSPRS